MCVIDGKLRRVYLGGIGIPSTEVAGVEEIWARRRAMTLIKDSIHNIYARYLQAAMTDNINIPTQLGSFEIYNTYRVHVPGTVP